MVNCCVIGCKSRTERKFENITFHRFPKRSELRDMWIRSTGRENWTPKIHSRICSKHFNENCFRRTPHMTFLNVSSVPTLHIHRSGDNSRLVEVVSTAATAATTDAVAAITDTIQVQHPVDETMTPRKKKIINKLKRQTRLAETRKKKLALLRSKCRRIEKKNAELSEVIEKLKSRNLINQETADLLSSINLQKTDFLQSRKYSPEVRKFALHLHFISPRAYNFVRKTFNTCLPHARTLARWYQTVEAEPGFSEESLQALKLLVKNTESKRTWVCGLSFDEMAIRKSLQWDGKKIIGHVNCGHQLDNMVIIYIAGFVVKSLETQIKCEECLSCLRSSEKLDNTFLIRKDKGGLCHPSRAIIKLCEIAEEVYKKKKNIKFKRSDAPPLARLSKKVYRS